MAEAASATNSGRGWAGGETPRATGCGAHVTQLRGPGKTARKAAAHGLV